MYLLNAFSLNMVTTFPVKVRFQLIPIEDAAEHLLDGLVSAVGHADTAAVFSQLLGMPVPCERRTVHLRPTDCAILGQYTGPRLPEGATTLPEGAEIRWYLVSTERCL